MKKSFKYIYSQLLIVFIVLSCFVIGNILSSDKAFAQDIATCNSNVDVNVTGTDTTKPLSEVTDFTQQIKIVATITNNTALDCQLAGMFYDVATKQIIGQAFPQGVNGYNLLKGKQSYQAYAETTAGQLHHIAGQAITIKVAYLLCNSSGSSAASSLCQQKLGEFLNALNNPSNIDSFISTNSDIVKSSNTFQVDVNAGGCPQAAGGAQIAGFGCRDDGLCYPKCVLPGAQNSTFFSTMSQCSPTCKAQPGAGGPGGSQPAPTSYTFSLDNPLGAGYNNIEDLLNGVLAWITRLSIPIAVLMIIYAGIMFLTSGQYPKNFETGKSILKGVVIGLAIIFIGKGFISLIKSIIQLKS